MHRCFPHLSQSHAGQGFCGNFTGTYSWINAPIIHFSDELADFFDASTAACTIFGHKVVKCLHMPRFKAVKDAAFRLTKK
jgi:hypothetical protein